MRGESINLAGVAFKRFLRALLLLLPLFAETSALAATAFDTAGSYSPSGWTNGANGGSGFGPWRFFGATQDFSLASSTNAGGWNIDSAPNRSFALQISTQALTFRTTLVSRAFSLQTNEAVFCKAVMNNDGSPGIRQILIASGSATNFVASNIVCGVALHSGIVGVPDGFQVTYRTPSGVATNQIGSLAQLGPNVFFWCLRTGPTNYVYDIAIGTNDFAGTFSSSAAPTNFWLRNSATNTQVRQRVLHFNFMGVDNYDPDFRILDARTGSNSQITVTYPTDASHYYVLLRGGTVTGIASAVAVRVPDTSPDAFTNAMPATNTFLAIARHSRLMPGDLDGDGIDDLYELLNALNPLNAADAAQPAASGSGLTNYQEYRMLKGYDISPNDAVSRELSVFRPAGSNPGIQAVSRELSLFSATGTNPALQVVSRELSVFGMSGSNSANQTVSREISIFRTETSDAVVDALSREVSVFSLNGTNLSFEATSREVSVFGLEMASSVNEAISREVSVFSLAGTNLSFEATSREVSVFDFSGTNLAFEAVSREVSVFSTGGAIAAEDAWSREVSVFSPP